jgi:hypothetical protein
MENGKEKNGHIKSICKYKTLIINGYEYKLCN